MSVRGRPRKTFCCPTWGRVPVRTPVMWCSTRRVFRSDRQLGPGGWIVPCIDQIWAFPFAIRICIISEQVKERIQLRTRLAWTAMGLSFYSTTLLGLVGLATGFAFTQRPKTLGARLPSLHSKLKRNYLFAYALAVGGDWLQGSHLFSLYHDEYQIPLKTIGYLFVAGFLAAGLSAPFLGPLADRYGRKRACIGFGIAYSLSCATKLFGPSLPLLGTGRILGGAATTAMLLFETWLVSEAKAGGMGSLELGEFLGRCTLVNGIVASCSGIASEALVGHFKTFKAPFVASAILLIGALLVIQSTWTENYGRDELTREGEGSLVKSFKVVRGSEFIPPRSSPADEVDPSLLVLAIAMTAFETSLYLFVFLSVVPEVLPHELKIYLLQGGFQPCRNRPPSPTLYPSA